MNRYLNHPVSVPGIVKGGSLKFDIEHPHYPNALPTHLLYIPTTWNIHMILHTCVIIFDSQELLHSTYRGPEIFIPLLKLYTGTAAVVCTALDWRHWCNVRLHTKEVTSDLERSPKASAPAPATHPGMACTVAGGSGDAVAEVTPPTVVVPAAAVVEPGLGASERHTKLLVPTQR